MHAAGTAVTIQANKIVSNGGKDNWVLLEPFEGKNKWAFLANPIPLTYSLLLLEKRGSWILSGSFQLHILATLYQVDLGHFRKHCPFVLLLRKENECHFERETRLVCCTNNMHLPGWAETPRTDSEQSLPHLLLECKSHLQLQSVASLPEKCWVTFSAYCTTFIYNFRKKKINNETWVITHNGTGFHIPHYWRLIYLSFAISWHLIRTQKAQQWVMALWVLLSPGGLHLYGCEGERSVSYPNPLRAGNRGNGESSSKPQLRTCVCCGD